MLTGAALDDALTKTVTTRPGSFQHFRVIPLTWAFDPLGRGRPIEDMRFNTRGGARVLYLGENPTVCVEEAGAVGFPAAATMCFPVDVRLEAILDLRDGSTRKALGLKTSDIHLNFRGVNKMGGVADTQTLGERCAVVGTIDGISYPSVAHKGGVCLAVLESNLRSGKTDLVVRFPLGPTGVPMSFPVPPGRKGPPPGLPPDVWDRLP